MTRRGGRRWRRPRGRRGLRRGDASWRGRRRTCGVLSLTGQHSDSSVFTRVFEEDWAKQPGRTNAP